MSGRIHTKEARESRGELERGGEAIKQTGLLLRGLGSVH